LASIASPVFCLLNLSGDYPTGATFLQISKIITKALKVTT